MAELSTLGSVSSASIDSSEGDTYWRTGIEGGIVFIASDITGATDITSELVSVIEAAAGKVVHIPKGVYLINDLVCDSDVRVSCAAEVEFKYNYGHYGIQQRNEDTAQDSDVITAIDDVTFGTSQKVTRVTVAISDIGDYSVNDIVHIHSQNNWLSGDTRRVGQASKIMFIDTVEGYIYLNELLFLTAELTTFPRIRVMSTRVFEWQGGHFSANGSYDDVSLGDASSRRPAIEVRGTPKTILQGIKASETWAMAFQIKGCPFSRIDDVRLDKLPNLLCADETARNITGITQADPAVLTLDNVSGLSSGDDIVIWGVGGMTELNQRPYRISSISGNDITLDDYYAATGDIDSTGFTSYTSGGSLALGDVNALGYGVWVYGSCCHSVITNVVGTECRHMITSDGINDSSYDDAQYAEYGFPCNVSVSNSISHDGIGVAFDEHEEAINWTWTNCHAVNSQRGGQGGSYQGYGFQMRGTHSNIVNCSANGGSGAFRFVPQDAPIASKYVITNSFAKNIRGRDDGTGYGLQVSPNSDNPTTRANITIDGVLFEDCGTGIDGRSGGDITVGAQGATFKGCDEVIDIEGGIELRALGKLGFDFRNSPFGTPHYCIRMRSDGTLGGSKAILLAGASMIVGANGSPASLFYEADTNATKEYYCPTGMFVQDTQGFTEALLVNSGATTMEEYSETIDYEVVREGLLTEGTLPKVSTDGKTVEDSFLTQTDSGDDAGLNCSGQFSVGSAGNRKEFIAGEGDSYPVVGAWHCEVSNTTDQVITSAVDITTNMQSDSSSPSNMFNGTSAGKYLLVYSNIKAFCGMKTKIDTAGIVEADNIVFEQLATLNTWSANRIMSVDANDLDKQYANVLANVSDTSEQWRTGFDPLNLPLVWSELTMNINGTDYTGYFARIRITDTITTDPILEQIKLHTDRFEVNPSTEYFGDARYPETVQIKKTGNADSNPSNENIKIANGITEIALDNQFNNGTIDGMILSGVTPIGIDTSILVQIIVDWYPMDDNSGDVELELHTTVADCNFVYDGNATAIAATSSITSVDTQQEEKQRSIFSLDISAANHKQKFYASLFRDASLGNSDDTYTGNIAIVDYEVIVYKWRP